jgi:hypothetical protein
MADMVSRIYSNFRGVDFRGEEINLARSPDSLNVWKDYKNTESIRTRPGMKKVFSTDFSVLGIYFLGDEMVLVGSNGLYRMVDGKPDNLHTFKNTPTENFGCLFNGKLYLLTGKNYFVYDLNKVIEISDTRSTGELIAHIPTTSNGRKPDGSAYNPDGYEVHEDVNLLTDLRKNSFVGDGVSKVYKLDETDITDAPIRISLIGDYEITDQFPEFDEDGNPKHKVDRAKGEVIFDDPLPNPLTDGQDNVVIEFQKHIPGNEELIKHCTLMCAFDNRLFFSGNPDYPNRVWHCALQDPTYCSDTDEYTVGFGDDKVNGLVPGNNALWVFLEPTVGNAAIHYLVPYTDENYGKVYSDSHSNIDTSCIGAAVNFNDDIVYFSERGMEGVNGDITTEQAIAHRSTVVDSKLLSEKDYRNMITAEWNGYLLVFIGNKCYLADSRAIFTNENHYEYEWFYWEMEKDILCTQVKDGVLYLGTKDGVYTLTDLNANIPSYWVTPKDKFKYPNKLKTTNKRGCVVEAAGDVSVYAKTEDTAFELIGKYENVEDYFVSRIKRKKFKDIQLKFQSDTRFSLETATLEAFIGGYIKR